VAAAGGFCCLRRCKAEAKKHRRGRLAITPRFCLFEGGLDRRGGRGRESLHAMGRSTDSNGGWRRARLLFWNLDLEGTATASGLAAGSTCTARPRSTCSTSDVDAADAPGAVAVGVSGGGGRCHLFSAVHPGFQGGRPHGWRDRENGCPACAELHRAMATRPSSELRVEQLE